jgi:hypothetical protein
LHAAEAIRALRAEPVGASLTVIGFYSHVHGDRAEQAASAGASRVMPRSAFVRELPGLIAAGAAPA